MTYIEFYKYYFYPETLRDIIIWNGDRYPPPSPIVHIGNIEEDKNFLIWAVLAPRVPHSYELNI